MIQSVKKIIFLNNENEIRSWNRSQIREEYFMNRNTNICLKNDYGILVRFLTEMSNSHSTSPRAFQSIKWRRIAELLDISAWLLSSRHRERIFSAATVKHSDGGSYLSQRQLTKIIRTDVVGEIPSLTIFLNRQIIYKNMNYWIPYSQVQQTSRRSFTHDNSNDINSSKPDM